MLSLLFPRLTARRAYAAAYRSFYRGAAAFAGINRTSIASARRCAMSSALYSLTSQPRAHRALMASALGSKREPPFARLLRIARKA